MSEKEPRTDDGDFVYCTEFRHWRSGEIIRAADHGLKAFRFPRKKK